MMCLFPKAGPVIGAHLRARRQAAREKAGSSRKKSGVQSERLNSKAAEIGRRASYRVDGVGVHRDLYSGVRHHAVIPPSTGSTCPVT